MGVLNRGKSRRIRRAWPDLSTVINGDCVQVLASMPADSVTAVVCDPPYGIAFMGKEFDKLGHGRAMQAWHVRWLRQAYRVLKPGGHLFAFGATRAFHRLACAAEDLGFEIRDVLDWKYGSGYPHGANIGKELPEFTGWGTGLKPSREPILMARKPTVQGWSVADTMQHYKAGALNIDACRVALAEGDKSTARKPSLVRDTPAGMGKGVKLGGKGSPLGRWPPNTLLTHSALCGGECAEDCPVAGLERDLPGSSRYFPVLNWSVEDRSEFWPSLYTAKASRKERDAGCDSLPSQEARSGMMPGIPIDDQGKVRDRFKVIAKNIHPTVKPLSVMQWLLRLVAADLDGALVVDPFAGSGTTVCAGAIEGIHVVGIEKDREYANIANTRVAHYLAKSKPQAECS